MRQCQAWELTISGQMLQTGGRRGACPTLCGQSLGRGGTRPYHTQFFVRSSILRGARTAQLKLGDHESGLGFAMYRHFFVRVRVLEFMNKRYMGAAWGHAAYKPPAGRVPSRGAYREFLQLGTSGSLASTWSTAIESLANTYRVPIQHLSDRL